MKIEQFSSRWHLLITACIACIFALVCALTSLFFISSTLLTVGVFMGAVIALMAGAWILKLESVNSVELESEAVDLSYSIDHKQAKLLFNTLFDSSSNGIAIVDSSGKILKANDSLAKLFCSTQRTIEQKTIFDLFSVNIKDQLQRLVSGEVNHFEMEQTCCQEKEPATWLRVRLTFLNSHEHQHCLLLEATNITTEKEAEDKLSHMAYHDPLTGLANRNRLEQFINHLLAQSRRHQESFALVLVDLDRFKNINDTIGHDAGDLLLQVVADRLKSTIRNTDVVARLGGDEFVLVITDVYKSESVALIAEKILKAVIQPVVIKGQELYITTSIGISLYPFDGQNIQTLLKNADLALYRAKDHGKNTYQFYTMEMTTKAQERMALQNALGHALVKEEFLLNYQPKLDLKTRNITGLEALLRWSNKKYSLITPDEIVELSEETGLIVPVSEWVLHTGCQQLKKWHSMGFKNLSLAVNCSARQFKQVNFADTIMSIVSEHGLSPQFIELEVTEKIIMQDPDHILRALYAIRDLGAKVVIDDFGTGYWSLNNLRKLSVDHIKIDKTFIKKISKDEVSEDIVKAIIAMLNKLDIKSVAEGVETRDQYEFLVREGCSEIQGYYITKPLPFDAMTLFLKHPVPDAELAVVDQDGDYLTEDS